jgi:predicted F0F1-ATPase subunit
VSITDGRDDVARRPDLRTALRRDLRRFGRRESDSRSFWRSLGVLGSVGWPLAAAIVGGALAGRWLDALWGTGIRLTLLLLSAGAIAGAVVVWHLIQPRSP